MVREVSSDAVAHHFQDLDSAGPRNGYHSSVLAKEQKAVTGSPSGEHVGLLGPTLSGSHVHCCRNIPDYSH